MLRRVPHPLPARPNTNTNMRGRPQTHVEDEDGDDDDAAEPRTRPRNRLGGAVLTRGGRQINFRLPPRPRPLPGALVDPEGDDGEADAGPDYRPDQDDPEPLPAAGIIRPAARRVPGQARVPRHTQDQMNAQLNAQIERVIWDRDDGGIPGLMDQMRQDFNHGLLDINTGWLERLRAIRQGLGFGLGGNHAQ